MTTRLLAAKSFAVSAQNRRNALRQLASGGVLRIDPNIFCGQIAGQEFASGVSHTQINANMHGSLQHGLVNFILVEVLRMLAILLPRVRLLRTTRDRLSP